MSIEASSVVRFSRQMTRFYNDAFDPLLQAQTLTMRELHVLLFLTNNPQFDTAKEICQRRGLLKSQVSQGVETLCKRGLLARQADEMDRRCVHLRLTATGQIVGKEAQILQQTWWNTLTASLSQEESAQVEHLMEKLLTSAKTMEDHP